MQSGHTEDRDVSWPPTADSSAQESSDLPHHIESNQWHAEVLWMGRLGLGFQGKKIISLAYPEIFRVKFLNDLF